MQPAYRASLWDCIGDAEATVLQQLSLLDLAVLSRVSKACRANVEPLMYANVWLWWTGFGKRKPPVGKMLRTLLRRPDLASHVRRVTLLDFLSWLDWSSNNDYTEVPDVSKSELEEIMAFLDTSRLSDIDIAAWKRCLSSRQMHAFSTLLVSQLHNLAYLEVDTIFARETRHLGDFLSASVAGEKQTPSAFSSFQFLETVKHRSRHDRGTVSASDLIPFFYLPKLHTFEAQLCHPSAFKGPMQPPVANALTTLHLTEVHESLLGHLLSCAPNLKNFRWGLSQNFRAGGTPNNHAIDLDVLAAALQYVRHTLEVLTLEGEQDVDYSLGRSKGSMDCLYGFANLRTLIAPIGFLGTSDPADWNRSLARSMPQNVQSITITDDMYAWFDEYAHSDDEDDQNEDEREGNEEVDEEDRKHPGRIRSDLPEGKLLEATDNLLQGVAFTHPLLETLSLNIQSSKDEHLLAYRRRLLRLGLLNGIAVAFLE